MIRSPSSQFSWARMHCPWLWYSPPLCASTCCSSSRQARNLSGQAAPVALIPAAALDLERVTGPVGGERGAVGELGDGLPVLYHITSKA